MRSYFKFRNYQERIEKVKAYIQAKESIEGRPISDEDFTDEGAPCSSKPEVISKDGYVYWRIDGDLYIDRSDEQLISNETTFNDLIQILSANPDVAANAEVEKEERAAEQREVEMREKFGDDYDLVFDIKKENQGKPRRPGAIQLRAVIPHVAVIECQKARLEVFTNGYAIYDNGNRKVVMWVLDCGPVTYYFTGLRDNEKEYLSQKEEISMDILGDLPWYHALMISGENRIEYNMDHPKSKGNTSDFDMEEAWVIPASHWVGSYHFDTPEEAYLKKEAAEERWKALTEKQREVYTLRYEFGMSEEEIAGVCNIARRTARDRLELINQKFKANPEKYFFSDTAIFPLQKPNK